YHSSLLLFHDPPTPEIYPLSLHDALPISHPPPAPGLRADPAPDLPALLLLQRHSGGAGTDDLRPPAGAGGRRPADAGTALDGAWRFVHPFDATHPGARPGPPAGNSGGWLDSSAGDDARRRQAGLRPIGK